MVTNISWQCDETRPECKNCKKHSVTCDFISLGAGFSHGASPSTIGTPNNQASDNHLPSFERFTHDALNGVPPPGMHFCNLLVCATGQAEAALLVPVVQFTPQRK